MAQGQPTQVTAQLIQTPQGPRIVLQGIQGANLSKDQLQSIQQQVKDQLLKAQAEAKSQGKIPPTKIAIQLPPMTPAGQALTSPPLAALPQQPQQIIANKTQVPTVVSSTKPITVNQVQTVTQSKSLLYFQNHFPKIQKWFFKKKKLCTTIHSFKPDIICSKSLNKTYLYVKNIKN